MRQQLIITPRGSSIDGRQDVVAAIGGEPVIEVNLTDGEVSIETATKSVKARMIFLWGYHGSGCSELAMLFKAIGWPQYDYEFCGSLDEYADYMVTSVGFRRVAKRPIG